MEECAKMNFTIAKKIFISIGAIVLCSLLNGIYAVYTVTKSANNADVVAIDLSHANTLISDLSFNNMYLQYSVLRYQINASENRYKIIYDLIDKIKMDLVEYEKYVNLPKTKEHSPRTVAEFGTYKSTMLGYVEIADKNISLLKSVGIKEAKFDKEIEDILSAVSKALNALPNNEESLDARNALNEINSITLTVKSNIKETVLTRNVGVMKNIASLGGEIQKHLQYLQTLTTPRILVNEVDNIERFFADADKNIRDIINSYAEIVEIEKKRIEQAGLTQDINIK